MAHNNPVEYYSQKELKSILKRIKKLLINLKKTSTKETSIKEIISLYESGIWKQKNLPDLSQDFKAEVIISLLIFAVSYFEKKNNSQKKLIGDILSSPSTNEYKSTVYFVARMAKNEEIGPKDVLELLQRNESIRNSLIEAFVSEMCKNGNKYNNPDVVYNGLKRLRIPKMNHNL